MGKRCAHGQRAGPLLRNSETYDESGEVAGFALVAARHPSLAHELVHEGVYDRGRDGLGELQVQQDEELHFRERGLLDLLVGERCRTRDGCWLDEVRRWRIVYMWK